MNRLTRPQAILLTAVALLIIGTAVVGQRLVVQSYSPLSCVVEDFRTGGGSGIRAWAERMGYRTAPFRHPIWEIEGEFSTIGNCLITAGNDSWGPFGGDLADDDWASIHQWIRRGNTLIVISSTPSAIPHQIQEHFIKQPKQPDATDQADPSFESSKRQWISESADKYQNVPTRWGGEMSVHTDGPRLKAISSEWQIAGTGNMCVLAGKPLERGSIYLLLDSDAWTNRGFDQADNAATLARIFKQNLNPDGVLAFDEYRHGYGRIESFTTLFLSLPGASAFAWMSLIWFCFWLWSSSRRMRPAEEAPEIERRTAREYIESVASMNQRARAAPLAVKAVLLRVRYLLQRRGIDDEALSRAFVLADGCVEAAARPASPNNEVKLVSELIQLRRDLYGTRRDSRAN